MDVSYLGNIVFLFEQNNNRIEKHHLLQRISGYIFPIKHNGYNRYKNLNFEAFLGPIKSIRRISDHGSSRQTI